LQTTVAGCIEVGCGSTPLIAVQRKEVETLRHVRTADQIVLQHWAENGGISRGIPDRDLAVTFGIPICFKVCSGCKQVRGRRSIGHYPRLAVVVYEKRSPHTNVEHLIANEEASSIVELLKVVHDSTVRV
jgi:hypothetical protein